MNSKFIMLFNKWPDLVITFLGVLGGGLVALWIAKWQLSKQEVANARKDEETLKLLFGRLKVELRDNKNTVQQLQGTLNSSKNARLDIWKWAITIVDSFSSNVYDDLIKTSLQRNLPKKVEARAYISYKMIKELAHMVKQAVTAHNFYYGYSGAGEKLANQLFENVKTFSQTVLEHLEDATNAAYEYDEILSKEQNKEPS